MLKDKIELYTSVKVEGEALNNIAKSLTTLTRKDIIINGKEKLSVFDLAIKEGACSHEKSKIMERGEFHVSLGNIEYECNITRDQLMKEFGSGRDKCIKDIKNLAFEKIKNLKFKLGKTTNDFDQKKFYGNWEAISLKQITGDFEIENPHLSLIKGGDNIQDSEKCLTALYNVNNRYHNNKDDKYYTKINEQEKKIITADAIEITIPGQLNTVLNIDIPNYHDYL